MRPTTIGRMMLVFSAAPPAITAHVRPWQLVARCRRSASASGLGSGFQADNWRCIPAPAAGTAVWLLLLPRAFLLSFPSTAGFLLLLSLPHCLLSPSLALQWAVQLQRLAPAAARTWLQQVQHQPVMCRQEPPMCVEYCVVLQMLHDKQGDTGVAACERA